MNRYVDINTAIEHWSPFEPGDMFRLNYTEIFTREKFNSNAHKFRVMLPKIQELDLQDFFTSGNDFLLFLNESDRDLVRMIYG